MKKGVIIINAYANMVAQEMQANRLLEEFKLQEVDVYIAKNNDYQSFIGNDGGLHTGYRDVDFAVFLDKDKYLPRILERSGIKVFNSAQSIEVCDDKMLTHLSLAGFVPQPKTMSAPLCYTKNAQIGEEEAEKVIKEMGLPVVVKESFGSRGRGVYLIESKEDLLSKMNELKGRPYIFQEYIKESFGRDVRLTVIGGKVFSAMLRKSEKDFRSNIDLGGIGYPITPSKEFIEVAEKCAEVLGLDYAGVDILFGKDDKPIVAEVNSNAFFMEMERVTGKNVAKEFATHILRVLEK